MLPQTTQTYSIPSEINFTGLNGWYQADSFDTTLRRWNDKSGNNNHAITKGGNFSINSQLAGEKGSYKLFNYVYGDTTCAVKFDAAFNIYQKYTLFHVTAYDSSVHWHSPTDVTLYKERIFQGDGENYISGHHAGRIVRYYQDGWLYYEDNFSIQDKWLLSMDSQNHIRSYHTDGSLEDYSGGGNISNLTSININDGNAPAEYSNWNCAEVIFYNRKLNYSEIVSVENYLKNKYFGTVPTTIKEYQDSYALRILGDNTNEVYGENIPSYIARSKNLIGLCIDPCGNLFFGGNSATDTIRMIFKGTITNLIRKNLIETGAYVDASFVVGNVYKVAGTGTDGYTGDDGLAINATFNQIRHMNFDASGNLYIPDYLNSTIRKIDSETGIISRVVGTYRTSSYLEQGFDGAALSCYLKHPELVRHDSKNNMYILTHYNGNDTLAVVYKGTSTPLLNATMGVYYSSLQQDYIYKFEGYDYRNIAIDNNNNIWMTSYYNKEISVWFNEQNDLITGLIGTMTSDSIGKQLFVAKPTIHDIDSLYLSFDNSNNLYITDHSNQVWKINNTGTKTIKVAGNGEEGWNGDANSLSIQMDGPQYVVTDASNNVYIQEYNNDVIRQLFDVDGSMNILGGTDITGVTGDGGDAREARIDDQNYAVTLDSCGNIFFAGNDDQIRMIFKGTTTPLITS